MHFAISITARQPAPPVAFIPGNREASGRPHHAMGNSLNVIRPKESNRAAHPAENRVGSRPLGRTQLCWSVRARPPAEGLRQAGLVLQSQTYLSLAANVTQRRENDVGWPENAGRYGCGRLRD